MYNLLANGSVSTMKLLSSSGVLPGAGGVGATQTYTPSKQTCSNGCALDGSGCGALGNDQDVERCDNIGSTFSPTKSPVGPTTITSAPVAGPTKSPVKAPTLSPTTSAPNPTPVTSAPVATPSSSSNCKDSELKMFVNKKLRYCTWVERNTTKRCKKRGVESHCPLTCDTCEEDACSDSSKKFEMTNGNTKRCGWVGKKEGLIDRRCNKEGIASVCRETCGFCE